MKSAADTVIATGKIIIAIRMIFGGGEGYGTDIGQREPFIFPLAVPLLAGPSAMATVLLLASRQPEHLVQWIGALGSDVLFSSTYGAVSVVEIMDPTQYLDSAFFVNAPPATLTPPGGKGPLWFAPSTSVTLMDQGTRMMGTYQIDANGFIIPQFNDGENLAAATLVAGQPWTGIMEPFADDAQSGQDMHQRMLPRRISYFSAYVVNSTGFALAKLFSAKLTPTSPALGTVMNIRRVPAWNQGDNPILPPPLRETVEEWRPSGYSYDPRVAIIKDTPGPLEIQELGMEISI